MKVLLGFMFTLLISSMIWMIRDMTDKRLQKRLTQYTSLKEAMKQLKNGDIFVMSLANWMQALSRSHITHIAMVFKDPSSNIWQSWETCRRNNATVRTLDSLLLELYDEGKQREKNGFIHGRHSTLWVLHLGKELNYADIQTSIEKHRGSKYSFGLWKAFSSLVVPLSLELPILDQTEDEISFSKKSMYCSELISQTLIECGALQDTIPSYSYIPGSFWAHASLPWSPEFAPKNDLVRVILPSGELNKDFFSEFLHNIY